MSFDHYAKAYITHNNGKSLATIDENNNFVDLGYLSTAKATPLIKFMG